MVKDQRPNGEKIRITEKPLAFGISRMLKALSV